MQYKPLIYLILDIFIISGHKKNVNATNIEELDNRRKRKNNDAIQECQSTLLNDKISQYSSVMEKKRPEMLSTLLPNSIETQKQKCFVSTGLDVLQLVGIMI